MSKLTDPLGLAVFHEGPVAVVRISGSAGMVEADIIPDQLYQADECFLTGTAAEVIAVTKVDDCTIGTGKPGTVTTRLLKAFRDYIATGDFE